MATAQSNLILAFHLDDVNTSDDIFVFAKNFHNNEGAFWFIDLYKIISLGVNFNGVSEGFLAKLTFQIFPINRGCTSGYFSMEFAL